jgi:hypothetical protein
VALELVIDHCNQSLRVLYAHLNDDELSLPELCQVSNAAHTGVTSVSNFYAVGHNIDLNPCFTQPAKLCPFYTL